MRHDVARGGSRRPNARNAQRDANEPLWHRAVCIARAGNRPRDRLETVRQLERRQDARATDADEAPDGARAKLRYRVRLHFAERSAATRADPSHRRFVGGGVDSRRRQGQSDRLDAIAREGRAVARRANFRRRQSDGRQAPQPAHCRIGVDLGRGERRNRLRDRRQLRWPMGARVGRERRRQRAALFSRALLRRDQTHSRRYADVAGDP